MGENEEELLRLKKRRGRYKALIVMQFLILCLLIFINVKVIVPELKRNEINREEQMKNQMDEAERLAFNAKFSAYSGTQRGSQVNRLLDEIKKNNNKEKLKNENDRIMVSVSGEITIDDNGNVLTDSKVLTSMYYEVKTNTDEKGYINHIFIEKNME